MNDGLPIQPSALPISAPPVQQMNTGIRYPAPPTYTAPSLGVPPVAAHYPGYQYGNHAQYY